MVNPELINERLREMRANILLLEEFNIIPFDKFNADPKTIKATEHCLQLSIQCILDIGHHIVVDNDWPRPNDNKEMILVLGQKGIFPIDFANRIVPMVGFRNILVHEYLKIDTKQLYSHLQYLQDFHEFQKHIIAYLKSP